MMQYRIWDDMSACTQQDVARMLAVVPDGRKQYAMRYRHLLGQWTSLKVWEMVYQMAGIDQDWQVGQYGKPFVEGGVCFSVSHCKAGVAVAVDDAPIGIDIETIRHVDESLIRRTMNEKEQTRIRLAAQPAVMFTELWTQKEAVLKCKGTGIIEDMRGVLEQEREWRWETIRVLDKGYIVSICR